METKSPTTKKVSKANQPAGRSKATSLEAQVYSQKGASLEKITLPKSVFGLSWNADLVHQVVVAMMANKRAGTAHTKDRSEVSGGGKKPWKQKGTGRARHGSSRSPIWVGGGVTFGPRIDKDYSQKINKKMRTKALFTVLSKKQSDSSILFLDTLSFNEMKTKEASNILADLSKVSGFEKINSKKATNMLLVLPNADKVVEKSFANLPGVTVGLVKDMSAFSAINFRYIVMVAPNESIALLESKLK
ncbi:50S ribosomal protein L4 [Candidatus Nomurabacteria bacterium]|nr:50S ribosomal protein L4 [Candidatus Nomurabacteria bacterium]